jgi:hypothetical protein
MAQRAQVCSVVVFYYCNSYLLGLTLSSRSIANSTGGNSTILEEDEIETPLSRFALFNETAITPRVTSCNLHNSCGDCVATNYCMWYVFSVIFSLTYF